MLTYIKQLFVAFYLSLCKELTIVSSNYSLYKSNFNYLYDFQVNLSEFSIMIKTPMNLLENITNT